jgi:hypothetical protein
VSLLAGNEHPTTHLLWHYWPYSLTERNDCIVIDLVLASVPAPYRHAVVAEYFRDWCMRQMHKRVAVLIGISPEVNSLYRDLAFIKKLSGQAGEWRHIDGLPYMLYCLTPLWLDHIITSLGSANTPPPVTPKKLW